METSHTSNKQKFIFMYFFLLAIESAGSFLYLFFIPADLKNQILFGFSLPRLIMLMVFILIFIIAVSIGIYFLVHKGLVSKFTLLSTFSTFKIVKLFILAIFSLVITFTFIIIPFNSIRGPIGGYGERLKPFFLLVFLFSLQSAIYLFIYKRKSTLPRFAPKNQIGRGFSKLRFLLDKFFITIFFLPYFCYNDLIQIFDDKLIFNSSILKHKLINSVKCNKKYWILSGIIFLLFLSLWTIIAWTGIGNTGNWLNFSKPGIPLLGFQVWVLGWTIYFICIVHNLIIPRLNKVHFINANRDVIICIILFLTTALVWLLTPAKVTLFESGPYPPNNTEYPYSDAARWDLNGKSALIGEGFGQGDVFADHLGYSAFLAILSVIANNDYSSVIFLQVIIFSVFPVIIYLIGKSLHNRKTGLFLSGLLIIHPMNMILLRSRISASNVKVLMTEYPTAICLSFLTLLLLSWFKTAPQKKLGYALPIGGILGILILIRFTTLVFPFAVIGILLIIFQKNWRLWLKSSFIVVLSMIIVLSPWIWRSWKYSGTPFFFMAKSILVIDSDFRNPNVEQGIPITGDSLTDYPSNEISPMKTQPPGGYLVNHFVHSLISSIVILPTSPIFYDLAVTVTDPGQFRANLGERNTVSLSLTETILLIINLAVISAGITNSLKKWRLTGLIPLIVFVMHIFASAFARTSGGRYIVPIAWVVLMYYGLGLGSIYSFLSRTILRHSIEDQSQILIPPAGNNSFSYKQGVLLALPFFLFVALMTGMDRLIPKRYSPSSSTEVVNYINASNLLSPTEFLKTKIFLEDPFSTIFVGQEFYPRFYESWTGLLPDDLLGYETESYSRLVFKVIGPNGLQDVVLQASKSPEYFPSGKDVLIFGCKHPQDKNGRSYIDALMVILLEKEPIILERDPHIQWKCSLIFSE